jgi:hypothetical protein
MLPWFIGVLALIVILATLGRRAQDRAPNRNSEQRPAKFHPGCPMDAVLLPLHASDEGRRSVAGLWKWLVGPDATVAEATPFGDLVVRDGNGELVLIDTTRGVTVKLAAAGESTDVAGHPEIVRRSRRELVSRMAKFGRSVPPDHALDWMREPALGGTETPDNLQFISFLVQQTMRATLHEQRARR